MTFAWQLAHACKNELRHVAERLALVVRRGDVIALHGDVGAGKTTLVRALVSALLDEAGAEVPSPTFSLAQTYDTPRLRVTHFDFFRLTCVDEARELGFEEAWSNGAVVVEWPERAAELLPADRLDIRLTETSDPSARGIALEGHGNWQARMARLASMDKILRTTGWSRGSIRYLQGDASTRSYARLDDGARRSILMDAPRRPDGPPIRGGRPYSRIAHLAEDVRPFVAVARALREAGLAAPEIYAQDLDEGFLLFEDLGDRLFALELDAGTPQAMLWHAAVDVLIHLRQRACVPAALDLGDGSFYHLPAYDRGVLQIEADLLLDWYWPALRGEPVPVASRDQFARLWNNVFDKLLALPTGWVLRDYHSPNLIWLAARTGVQRVGVIDFQDALQGHPAYDLVSLLQDARLDVPKELEATLFNHYCNAVSAAEPEFDRSTFAFAYAALGAQRNTKILGIFARLASRDGKSQYLRHIPRIWRYLQRDLAHMSLGPLQDWYDANFPPHERMRTLGR